MLEIFPVFRREFETDAGINDVWLDGLFFLLMSHWLRLLSLLLLLDHLLLLLLLLHLLLHLLLLHHLLVLLLLYTLLQIGCSSG